ncbi:ADP-ribosylglycohydrolase family protein [Sphaerochaeta sp. PS]|uniref:ADP-ribosylglycohydrolase family protein n=1 Tax=Sphaerochaeta sp. PS TaxID=3076336 RepID=UPI0028A435A6|nr:ADP-ribosylglycohydrolase family protein [Sphaerochaeta sp. PS]MDT4762763.1 ADP-ribosylglycohydrolase family protein [Sphaerochaeta sp. PS]
MEAINRATGALLGMFVGDALGIQAEGKLTTALHEEFPQGIGELYTAERTWGESGELTDGSVMAILLSQSITQLQRFDADHVLSSYRKWAKWDPPLVRPLLKDILEDGPQPKSENNYALMRVAPIGILGANLSDKEIVAMAEAESIMTNLSQLCIDANKALSLGISEAIINVQQPFRFGIYLLSSAKKFGLHPEVQAALDKATKGVEPSFEPENKDSVLYSLQLALFSLLHTSSFEEGMLLVVNKGGSSSANGAIYGSLAGAFYGDEEIPSRWKEELQMPDTLARYIKKQTTFRRQNLNLEFMAEEMAEKLLEI